MSSATSTLQLTPLLQHCECDKECCNGEVVEIATSYAREIFIRCDPASIIGLDTSPKQQAEQFYTCLPRILEQAGTDMAHVVLERVFFRDVASDFDVFAEVRRNAYGRGGLSDEQLPVASYVGQPPCIPGQAFELQVYALVPNSPETASVTHLPATAELPPGKLVQMGDYRHLYVRNITGQSADGSIPESFRTQSDVMFEKGAQIVARHGITFRDVLRTWCYLVDIDGDYAEFNRSRNVFFERDGVKRLPASTGIRADLYPPGTLCGYDLYALLNPEGAEIEVMHTPTLNEADEYGSSFSRGMKLELPEKTVLFISGTASVDEAGATVHVDEVGPQIDRMLLNVEQLLAPHGASYDDLVQVITYLKSASGLELFREVANRRGLVDRVPNTIVEAGVCRPDLLCEIEAIAILPK